MARHVLLIRLHVPPPSFPVSHTPSYSPPPQTLATSRKDPTLEGRLRSISDALTYDVYAYTCLGLFERHKLMFSFQMTLKLLEASRPLDPDLLDFFLKGNLSLEKHRRRKPHEWLPEQGWQDLMRLMEMVADKQGPDGGCGGGGGGMVLLALQACL